jgi:hypothetical protein
VKAHARAGQGGRERTLRSAAIVSADSASLSSQIVSSRSIFSWTAGVADEYATGKTRKSTAANASAHGVRFRREFWITSLAR